MANYNLTNQTISSSFQQLLQKDIDTGYLVDGIGDNVGDITISGSVSASFFIGDGSGLTNLPGGGGVPAGTVSGSSQVDYPLISNIPSGIISSSQQLPAGLVSGSSQVSDITGSSLVTASFATQTLTFTKGDGTTFGVNIPDVSGSDTDLTSLNTFTSSQELLNTTFATTGSNTFVGNQTITGSLFVSSSTTNIFKGEQSFDIAGFGSKFAITGSNFFMKNRFTNDITQLNGSSVIFSGGTSGAGTNLTTVGLVSRNPNNSADAFIYSSKAWAIDDYNPPTGSLVGQSGIFFNHDTDFNNVLATNGVITMKTGSAYDGIIHIGNGLNTQVDGDLTATKLTLTGGTGTDLAVTGTATFTSNVSSNASFIAGTTNKAYLNTQFIGLINGTTSDEIGFTENGNDYGISGWAGPAIYANDPTDSYPALIGFQNKADWTDGKVTILKPLVLSGSLGVVDNAFIITSGSNSVEFNAKFSDGQAGVDFNAPNSKFNATGNFNIQVSGIAAVDAGSRIDLNQNTNITGTITQNLDSNNNAILQQNPNWLSEYHGTRLYWRPQLNNGEAGLLIGEKAKALLYINAYSGAYDNILQIKADASGVSFNDWDLPSYGDAPWLTIEQGGTPTFTRGLDVTGSVSITETMNLVAQDPLPAGAVGDLAVSGSNLFFYNGAWTQVV
tara:strand:- start:151 stop:2160 length:2010 start_codon:yes stop_codon:yes gene_type:complete